MRRRIYLYTQESESVNRPFAILKDLLPTRDKPASDKPATDRRASGSGNKSKSDRRKAGGVAPESRASRAPAPATAATAPKHAKRADPQSATQAERRPGPARGRSDNAPRTDERKPRPAAPPRQSAPAAAPVNPEQARKAAEKAAKLRALADEGLAALRAHHPGLFHPHQVKPLAIGIHKPLLEAARVGILGGTSVAAIRAAIGRWTSSRPYLQALKADAERIGLDGSPAGTVDAEQAAAAQTQLEQRAARNANRRRGGQNKGQGQARGKGKPAAQADTAASPAPAAKQSPASDANAAATDAGDTTTTAPQAVPPTATE